MTLGRNPLAVEPLTFTGSDIFSPFGVTGIGAVNGPALSDSSTKTITGVGATTAVHSPTFQFIKTISPTRVSAVGAVYAPKSLVRPTIVGVSNTGTAVGILRAAKNITLSSGVGGTGAVHGVTLHFTGDVFPTGVIGNGVANPIAYITTQYHMLIGVSGTGGVGHTTIPGVAYTRPLSAIASTVSLAVIQSTFVNITGVSATGAVHASRSGWTFTPLTAVANTNFAIPEPLAIISKVFGTAATHAIIGDPSPTPIGVNGVGAIHPGTIAAYRRLNSVSASGATHFAMRFTYTPTLYGVKGLMRIGPPWEYFYGNNPMITNNPLQLQETSIPVGSTVPPVNSALVVFSTLAQAPIWWNGVKWVLLFGGQTVLPGFIHHLHPDSFTGTSTTASSTVTAGTAVDTTGTVLIQLITGQNWSVSNGNTINGFDGGTTLPSLSTIHCFICTGLSGTGTFASTALAPTFPTGYNSAYRRIFSFTTNGSGAPNTYQWVQGQSGAMIAWLNTPVEDLSSVSPGIGSRTLYTMSVPIGISVEWLGNIVQSTNTGLFHITGPAEPDLAPSASAAPLYEGSASNVAAAFPGIFSRHPVVTNTSGQIGIRASSTLLVNASTSGFLDFRGI